MFAFITGQEVKNKGSSRLFGNTYESWDRIISEIDIGGISFFVDNQETIFKAQAGNQQQQQHPTRPKV